MNKAKKIIVVEDDEDIREALDCILSEEGFIVSTAGNGAELLEILKKEKNCDEVLIILDLIMPVMDGNRFIQIRKHDADLGKCKLLIFTSAQPGHHNLEDVQGFLNKTTDLDNILDAVSGLCEKSSSEKQHLSLVRNHYGEPICHI